MIGIIGQGFVGNAVYQKFKNYFNVFTYDLDISKSNSEEKTVLSQEIILICLPTPMNKDGSCNIDLIQSTLKKIEKYNKCRIAVVKSTVPPGTTYVLNSNFNNIDIIFNPEFLTEANAVEDFNNQSRIILGGPRSSTTELKRIYSKIFPKAHLIETDSTHAEMVKYLTNSFLSVKVIFSNEIFKICKKLQVDYDKVIEYTVLDDRLGKTHWKVPGPDGDFGFGGHCLPKDLSALIYLANNKNIKLDLLEMVKKINDNIRTNRDWEKMKGRAVV